ncbi:MAG: hypothetical protein ABIY46_12000 [Gemmatimonadales bacterium]
MMPAWNVRRHGRGSRLVGRALAVVVLAGCADADRLGPSGERTALLPPASAVASASAGVMFASYGLTPSQITAVHTGVIRSPTPSSLLDYLAQVRAKGGRVLIKLSGSENLYRNGDGTFSLAKWQSAVDKYRGVNFSSYIADGTIVGHYIIDEPHFASRWGGQVIPQSTVEAAAKYSKQLWPTLPTIVNAPAHWLAASTITYTSLDAGWAMFRAGTSSSPTTWAAAQVTKAKKKGLGLFAGLNVLDGGDGSSGFHGNYPKKWAMSANELRTYGSALLSQSYVCGFAMWKYSATYYDRADVKSAMTDLSAQARTHARTSCRQ